MTELATKAKRELLKSRHEPYWQRLDKGRYLGFRRGPDTWHVRLRDRSKKRHQSILESVVEYDEAKRAAEKWLQQMGSAPVRSAVRGTVQDALQTYLSYLCEQSREATAKIARSKFKKVVWNDPLATIRLQDMTREDFREWRERLRVGRQNRSVNRIVRDVQAGLNRAMVEGHIGDPQAWRLDPLADDIDSGGTTAVLLTPGQRQALIKAATPASGAFMRGLECTGARPGELAVATVADFDAKHGTLILSSRKGRPARLRARVVVLGQDGVDFFRIQARRKLPTARLFPNDQGMPWGRKEWAAEIRAAASIVNARARGKARIPPNTTAYSFRHSRISELLQTYSVDPLTVAMQTGTSIAMIERAYFKFIPAAMRERLSAVAEG